MNKNKVGIVIHHPEAESYYQRKNARAEKRRKFWSFVGTNSYWVLLGPSLALLGGMALWFICGIIVATGLQWPDVKRAQERKLNEALSPYKHKVNRLSEELGAGRSIGKSSLWYTVEEDNGGWVIVSNNVTQIR